MTSYFSSRAEAREFAHQNGGRVERLGTFEGGSFGCYPRVTQTGRYVGQRIGPGGLGPIPRVTIWRMTT
jgi:hypothetical protein